MLRINNLCKRISVNYILFYQCVWRHRFWWSDSRIHDSIKYDRNRTCTQENEITSKTGRAWCSENTIFFQPLFQFVSTNWIFVLIDIFSWKIIYLKLRLYTKKSYAVYLNNIISANKYYTIIFLLTSNFLIRDVSVWLNTVQNTLCWVTSITKCI